MNLSKLKHCLHRRNIQYLIHFTDSTNIPSIWINGLLSRDYMKDFKIKYQYNDNKRLDNYLDYISLSITNYNKQLYNAYKKRGAINDGVLIYVDSSILYKETNHRIYFVSNAASSHVPHGSSVEDFENMFANKVQWRIHNQSKTYYRYNQNINEPTYFQAEILFHRFISPRYIVRIERISNNLDINYYKQKMNDIEDEIEYDDIFGVRDIDGKMIDLDEIPF